MQSGAESGRILVAGLGNYLCGDDGVGIHALPLVAAVAPPGVETLDVGTAVWHLASLAGGACRVLAIDAVRAGDAPGTVYRLEGGEVAAWRNSSAHGVGMVEALQWTCREGAMPEITVLGVEPESLDCGTRLSASVKRALPRVVQEAQKILAAWTDSGNRWPLCRRKGSTTT